MEELKLVSVVIPVYNVEEFLPKCLQSVCDQTYRNLEIIVVDDSSPDRSANIVKSFANRDDRIKYVKRANGGLGAARNTGIAESHGEYICFIDSDDWVNEDYIELFMATAISDKSDVVISNIKYVFDDGTIRPRTPRILHHEVINRKEALSREFIGNEFKFHAPNKFCKRSMLVDNLISFPEGKLYEDVFTTYKILTTANRISLIPDFTYNYLQSRSGSIMNTKVDPKRFSDMFEALNQIVSDETVKSLNLTNEIQALYVGNIISLVNYLADRSANSQNNTFYKKAILSDRNSFLLTSNLWANPTITTVAKLRSIGIAHCFGLYCRILKVSKKIQRGI